MDIWDYFDRRERECRDWSLFPDPDLPNDYRELQGSQGMRGRILARLSMTDRAFISVSERITIRDGQPYRDEYAYYLVVDGAEYWARDRDPSHSPPEHGHGPDHVREEADEISFAAFAEQCWEIISDLPPLDEPDS